MKHPIHPSNSQNSSNSSNSSNSLPRYVRVLSIAGSDSGGGAGIQADLKTLSALGCYGMTAITAITAQNTQGVRAIHAVPPSVLQAQIEAVVEDMGVDAVKIGMLHSPEGVRVVADAIRRYQLPHVVLDPVMVSTSGHQLMALETIQVLVDELFPLAQVITPNLDEAALLLGYPLNGPEALNEAAHALRSWGNWGNLTAVDMPAVLLKGGHLSGNTVVDVLALADGRSIRLESPRIITHNGHGTGCTLSSAIAAHLALGLELPEAVAQARIYILGAIAAGAAVHTGHGQGPLNHGFAPCTQRVVMP